MFISAHHKPDQRPANVYDNNPVMCCGVVLLCRRALQVSVELQEDQVLKEPAVIPDGLENPVCPVPE